LSAAIGSHAPKVETASGTKPIPRDKHAPWHLATFASALSAIKKTYFIKVQALHQKQTKSNEIKIENEGLKQLFPIPSPSPPLFPISIIVV
jgi:hypothetical protein